MPSLRPLAAVVATLALAGLVGASCGVRQIPRPNGARCEGRSEEDAELCEGGRCIAFEGQNEQNVPGMCTTECDAFETCPSGDSCLGPFEDGAYYCLRRCTEDDDCYDGTVCVQNASIPFCWVTPVGS